MGRDLGFAALNDYLLVAPGATYRKSTSPEAILPNPDSVSLLLMGCISLTLLLAAVARFLQPIVPWLATLYVPGPVDTT
jgi:hypothetical protein